MNIHIQLYAHVYMVSVVEDEPSELSCTCTCDTYHRAAVVDDGFENELAVDENQLKDGDLGESSDPDVDGKPQ